MSLHYILSTELLSQGFLKNNLILYFKIFVGRCQHLIEKYSVNCPQMRRDDIDNYILAQSIINLFPLLPFYLPMAFCTVKELSDGSCTKGQKDHSKFEIQYLKFEIRNSIS